MAGPGVGFEYPSQEVSWLKRDVLLFANSIGATADELHFLYVSSATATTNASLTWQQELHPNFQVFPTYPIILRKHKAPLSSHAGTASLIDHFHQHSRGPSKKS